MTVTMTVTTNLRTSKRRVYIDGVRVSESRFNCYRAIGCCFTERTERVRRNHAVGVLRAS
jgi:hypothetical protein